jgi:hypothetical protein
VIGATSSERAARRRRDDGARGLGGGRVILRPALAYLAPVPAAGAAAVLGVVSTAALVAVAASAVLCALVRATVECVRVEALRDSADAWIVAHAVGQPTDDVVVRRMRELTDPRTRAALAAAVRSIAEDSRAGGWSWIVYPNHRGIRQHRRELVDLARELGDLSRPVAPRGVALAHRLVTAAGGPLHDPRRADELAAAVRDTIAALDRGGEDGR